MTQIYSSFVKSTRLLLIVIIEIVFKSINNSKLAIHSQTKKTLLIAYTNALYRLVFLNIFFAAEADIVLNLILNFEQQ